MIYAIQDAGFGGDSPKHRVRAELVRSSAEILSITTAPRMARDMVAIYHIVVDCGPNGTLVSLCANQAVVKSETFSLGTHLIETEIYDLIRGRINCYPAPKDEMLIRHSYAKRWAKSSQFVEVINSLSQCRTFTGQYSMSLGAFP